ncbi:MAG TPA: hypothetical protein VGN00_12750 [Puia sp.]|jgi:hypothetical protein
MAYGPYRNSLDDINFYLPDDQRRIFSREKITRMEGFCAEVVFDEDIVSKYLSPVTGDFWFSLKPGGYHIQKLVAGYDQPLNRLDYLLLDAFTAVEPVLQVSIAYFDGDEKEFRQFEHVNGRRYMGLRGLGEMIGRLKPLNIPESRRTYGDRFEKVYDFLKERGPLTELAIKRVFANFWLSDFSWDIDLFTITEDERIVALEVKHKYPSQYPSFGLNAGLKYLLDFLREKINVETVHVVLQKPDTGTPAIDLLTKKEWIEETEWKYTLIENDKLVRAREGAPKETSYGEDMLQGYFHIPLKYWKVLKMMNEDSANVRERLLEGIR